jgi:very-short-patch-repair endonuclease
LQALTGGGKLCARAAQLRKAGVLSEALLWNQIKQKKINGLNFDRQRVIGNYIADFCCKETGVIIEIDGYTHDCKIEYDERRERYMKSLGMETIHIPDGDVKKTWKR